MSDEHTQKLTDGVTFEERVFARFDALDAHLRKVEVNQERNSDAVDARFQKLEANQERILERLDALGSRVQKLEANQERIFERLDALDTRLQKLEIESERRSLETKPIWERALAQIAELQQSFNDFRREVHAALHDISRKIGVLGTDIVQLRADQALVETRLGILESKPSQ
jgi:chromosome segregation ATPase